MTTGKPSRGYIKINGMVNGQVRRLKPPLVMGILNVTPDSFSDGGRYTEKHRALKFALEMVEAGADIIDIGGESTRPGSRVVEEDEELSRVIPIIELICKESDILISIDTQKSTVAREALKSGAQIVNDVSGGLHDEKMFGLIAENGVPYILMHMQGTPETMQTSPAYENVIEDLIIYFKKRIDIAIQQGISRDQIILDPGVGFGKTLENNLDILAHMNRFSVLGCRMALGASRKSFIGAIDGSSVEERLGGSLAAVMIGHINNVDIFRVHDVKETRQALNILTAIQNHLD